jgi:hypothetical protein
MYGKEIILLTYKNEKNFPAHLGPLSQGLREK